jgi:outer membrane protein OmpA-like peptidoglycan-associated protein
MTIPAPVTIDRLPIPPEAALTPAAPNDPAPALAVEGPLYRPPMVSPGAGNGAIEEASFALDPGASQIPDSAEGKLRMIADEMRQQPSSRLEVRVYSPTKAHTDSTARRLSLARFLAIRGVLTQNGVPASRVDGRALTSEATALNADRVELYLER